METDFPAAHSMDSCWFGVDKDGRVGFFDTGEAGAQPSAGLVGRAAELAAPRLARALPTCDTLVDLRGRRLPYRKGGGLRHELFGMPVPTVMFLDSLDPVRADLAAGRATELKAKDGYAVVWPGLDDGLYERFHEGKPGLCRGCYSRFNLMRGDPDDPRPNLARHGIYTFGTLGTNATAYPYGLSEVPTVPVHVDQLPPDLRVKVREVTFERVSFAETPVFQPAEHMPCVSYDGSYEDMKGKSHSLPGVVDDEVSEAALRRYMEMRGLTEDEPEE
jgi:hypothetical protein